MRISAKGDRQMLPVQTNTIRNGSDPCWWGRIRVLTSPDRLICKEDKRSDASPSSRQLPRVS